MSELSSGAFLTRTATVVLYVFAAQERERDVVALASALWANTEVPAEARLDPQGLRAAHLVGIAFGSLLGIVLLGAGLARALHKWLRLAPSAAAIGAFLPLNALALLGLLAAHEKSAEAWLQLAVYLPVSLLLYRPLTRWLESPPRTPPSTGRPRRRLLHDQRGLSTLEYSVLFVVLLVAGVAVWRSLGDAVTAKIRGGTAVFESLGVPNSQGDRHTGLPVEASQGSGQERLGTDGDATPLGAAHAASTGPQANAVATGALPGAAAAARTTPGLLQRAEQFIKSTRPAQYALGLGAGILQGFTPGGFVAPSPYAASKPFELGRGVGQMAAGISQTIGGLGLIGGGGAATGAGAITTFTPAGPAGVALVAVGVPAVATGTAVVANGAASVLSGYRTFINAMSMSDDSPSGGGQPNSIRGSAPSKAAESAGELRPEQLGRKLGQGGNKEVFAVGNDKAVGARDGRVVIADPLGVRVGPGPSRNNLDMIKQLIQAASTR